MLMFHVSSTAAAEEDDDLEDGEIDESDEEVILVSETKAPEQPKIIEQKNHVSTLNKNTELKSSKSTNNNNKSSKSNYDNNEDFITTIEKQIANALKKDGIEPPQPNIKKQSHENKDIVVLDDNSDEKRNSSRSYDRRKRRKQRKEKNREKSARVNLIIL